MKFEVWQDSQGNQMLRAEVAPFHTDSVEQGSLIRTIEAPNWDAAVFIWQSSKSFIPPPFVWCD